MTSPGQSSSATAFAFRCRLAAASLRSGSKPNPLIGQPTRSGLLIPKTNSGRSSRFAAADEADRPIAFVRAAGIGHLRRANWPISGKAKVEKHPEYLNG